MKGVSRTVANYTLENIKDSEFCQDASAIFFSIQESLSFVSILKTFYNEIWDLELIVELLSIHHTNEKICSSTLAILQSFMLNLMRIQVNEKKVATLLIENDDGIELIDKVLTEHKDDMEIRIMCFSIVKTLSMSKQPFKTILHFSL